MAPLGVDVHLQTGDGMKIESIPDPKGIVSRIMPLGDTTFHLLRYVDPYGDTIFNGLQMEQIFIELKQLKQRFVPGSQEIDYICKIENMARRCKSAPHLYLKFIGD